jgi:hypothetical protein
MPCSPYVQGFGCRRSLPFAGMCREGGRVGAAGVGWGRRVCALAISVAARWLPGALRNPDQISDAFDAGWVGRRVGGATSQEPGAKPQPGTGTAAPTPPQPPNLHAETPPALRPSPLAAPPRSPEQRPLAAQLAAQLQRTCTPAAGLPKARRRPHPAAPALLDGHQPGLAGRMGRRPPQGGAPAVGGQLHEQGARRARVHAGRQAGRRAGRRAGGQAASQPASQPQHIAHLHRQAGCPVDGSSCSQLCVHAVRWALRLPPLDAGFGLLMLRPP